jgi:hypothetical protein
VNFAVEHGDAFVAAVPILRLYDIEVENLDVLGHDATPRCDSASRAASHSSAARELIRVRVPILKTAGALPWFCKT